MDKKILRGVGDLECNKKGEAYGNFDLFVQSTDTVMAKLLNELPVWIDYLESQTGRRN